jgi:hypothetical protein
MSWWHTQDLGVGGEHSSDYLLSIGWFRCEGTVTAKVEASDEPYYGGSSAVLEINLRL